LCLIRSGSEAPPLFEATLGELDTLCEGGLSMPFIWEAGRLALTSGGSFRPPGTSPATCSSKHEIGT
jgi:hypothetical protein